MPQRGLQIRCPAVGDDWAVSSTQWAGSRWVDCLPSVAEEFENGADVWAALLQASIVYPAVDDLHDEIRVLVSSTTDRVSAPPNCLTGWVFPSIAVTTFMK